MQRIVEGLRELEFDLPPSQFHHFSSHPVLFIWCVSGVEDVGYPQKAQPLDGYDLGGVEMTQCRKN
jgi:hypothetical protein